MSSAIFKAGNTAVITGGASGIGLALAKKCAGYGMKVVVADKTPGEVEGVAKTVPMDVSSLDDWAKLRDVVGEVLGGKINLLALNAGVGVKTAFEGEGSDPTGGWRKTLDTNLFGVINGLTTLLPLVTSTASSSGGAAAAAKEAAVVITGSKQGITNPPGNPAYNCSKAAVKSLAEHLSHDMARSAPGVGVHLLVPGWTWTPLAGAAGGGEKPAAAWSPEQVVGFLEAKMAEGQFWVLCPDNEVTEDMDRKRMLWSAGDAVHRRQPLSRWRDEYKDEAAEFMKRDI